MDKTPLERAIEAAGSASKLADALNIRPQALSQWDKVPPLRVLEVERITRIPRHELRPDIYPPPPPPPPTLPRKSAASRKRGICENICG